MIFLIVSIPTQDSLLPPLLCQNVSPCQLLSRATCPPCFQLPTRQRTSNKELSLFFFVSQNSSHLEMPPARPQWPSVTGWVQKMADSRFSLPQAAPPATRAGHSTGGEKFGNIWTRVQLPHYTENPGPTALEVKAFSSPWIYPWWMESKYSIHVSDCYLHKEFQTKIGWLWFYVVWWLCWHI